MINGWQLAELVNKQITNEQQALVVVAQGRVSPLSGEMR